VVKLHSTATAENTTVRKYAGFEALMLVVKTMPYSPTITNLDFINYLISSLRTQCFRDWIVSYYVGPNR
jgi:hypothetical protein